MNFLIKIYIFFFFKFYKWAKGRDNTPIATVVLTISFLIFLWVINLFLWLTIVLRLFHMHLNVKAIDYKFWLFVVLIGSAVLQYIFFVRSKKWVDYRVVFENLKPKSRRKLNIIFWIFLAGGFLFILGGLLLYDFVLKSW